MSTETPPLWTPRYDDFDEHMRAVRTQLPNVSESVFEDVIANIVRLRRRMDKGVIERTSRYFVFLHATKEHIGEVCTLSTRWMISILDTIVDLQGGLRIGAAAMAVVTMVNTIKLCESERLECGQHLDSESPPLPFPTELWDGVTNYVIRSGDMPRNMFARLDKVTDAAGTPVREIYRTIMKRLAFGPGLIARLAQRNPRFWE